MTSSKHFPKALQDKNWTSLNHQILQWLLRRYQTDFMLHRYSRYTQRMVSCIMVGVVNNMSYLVMVSSARLIVQIKHGQKVKNSLPLKIYNCKVCRTWWCSLIIFHKFWLATGTNIDSVPKWAWLQVAVMSRAVASVSLWCNVRQKMALWMASSYSDEVELAAEHYHEPHLNRCSMTYITISLITYVSH